jgi:hypothetical protein
LAKPSKLLSARVACQGPIRWLASGGGLAGGIVAAALIGIATFLSGSSRCMLIDGVLVAGWNLFKYDRK